jgi:SPP1 gp7 family putative phage head morphogenesis protein
MAVNRETLRLTAELTLVVDDQIGSAVRLMTERWVRAWSLVEAEWRRVTLQLANEVAVSGKPSRRTLRRAENVKAALNTTRNQLDELVQLTRGTLVGNTRNVVLETARSQSRIIAAQLPRGSADRIRVEQRADVPNRQLDAIIRRSSQRITSDLRPLTTEALNAVVDQLVLGSARGQNPRAVARQMVDQVQSAFNGGLSRALNVARTELMDGHRTAAEVAQNQHRDVLDGWQWLATLNARTCPACWGKHGTKHPLAEAGPHGHQQCRCSRMPLTKTWAELGINIPEPRSLINSGQTEFNKLPAARQLEIMGPTRLQGLKTGRLDWDELAYLKHNDGWRDAYYATPVHAIAARLNRAG